MTDADLARLLEHFNVKFPLNTVRLSQHEWSYYCAGNPESETILLLHGGGADAEILFRYIDGLSEHFHVIAPNYPPKLRTMEALTDGLSELLSHEQVNSVHVVGMAFGAAVVQIFVRRFLAMIQDVVLVNTVIPSDHHVEYANMQQKLMLIYPQPFLLWLSRRALRSSITTAKTPVSESQRAFWLTYYDGLYRTRMRKSQLLARAQLMHDYHQSYKFKGSDLKGWDGEMLIIQSDADEVVSEGDRGSVLAMYPRAYIQTLSGYDHLASILANRELLQSVLGFLQPS